MLRLFSSAFIFCLFQLYGHSVLAQRQNSNPRPPSLNQPKPPSVFPRGAQRSQEPRRLPPPAPVARPIPGRFLLGIETRPEMIPLNNSWTECLEVQGMSPVRDQGGLGICYAFTAATLLDQYRATQSDQPGPSCTNGGGHPGACEAQMISVLDIINKKSFIIKNGLSNLNSLSGDEQKKGASQLLLKVMESQRDLSFNNEACWPYGESVQNMLRRELKCTSRQEPLKTNERAILNKITLQLKDSYQAPMVLSGLVNNKSVNPYCRGSHDQAQKSLAVPPFKVGTQHYPSGKDWAPLARDIFNQVKQNRPVSLTLCEEPLSSGECSGLHEVVISGVKVSQNGNGRCPYLFKLQNSWGMRWQNNTGGGWVNGCDLTLNALSLKDGPRLTWLEPPPSKVIQGKEHRPSVPMNTCQANNSTRPPAAPAFDGPVDGGGLPGSIRY